MDSDTRKISLCLTHHDRVGMLIRSFEQVLNDDRINEVVIVDDNSDGVVYNDLLKNFGNIEKIKLFRNEENIGCYRNKKEAVSRSSNEWVIIFDSDNIISKDYIDKLYAYGLWDIQTIYAPSFANPFDYIHFQGRILHRQNIAKFVDQNRFDAMMNTMNYFVNRDEYLKVWDDKAQPYAIDSIYQNLQWIAAGNKFFVVPGLRYEHTIHKGSLYMKEGNLTKDLHKVIMNKFKQMK